MPASTLTRKERGRLKRATTFEELLEVALLVIDRAKKPVGMACGPITTGGKENPKDNMKTLKKAIKMLSEMGASVFDQMPFENHMQRIKATPYYRGGNHLLEIFYLPIFESGKITTLYFVSGWETSQGAMWEHEQAKRLGIKTAYVYL